MKIVKVCRDCGKYNSYKLYECAFCGANLEDDTIEVEDNEIEIKKKVEEEKALFDKQMVPVSKEAEFIDEHIFFYVKDNQICLDENSLREAIIYNLS